MEFEKIISCSSLGKACVVGSEETSYEDFLSYVNQLVDQFVECGFHNGMTVAVQIPSSVTYVAVIYALWKLNGTVILLDPRLSENEKEDILLRCKPNFSVFAGPRNPLISFRELERIEIRWLSSETTDLRQYALVQFTSGSTGKPKVIGRTEQSLLRELERLQLADHAVAPEDRVSILCSIHHTYGLITGVLQALSQGATVVFSTSPYAQAIYETVLSQQVTCIYGVPFNYELLTSSLVEDGGMKTVRFAASAGEILPDALKTRFFEKFGIKIGQVYGMTETGIISADYLAQYPDSVGRPLTGMKVKCENGSIWVARETSPYIWGGDSNYMDGWLKTNDLGQYDESENLLFIHGRSDSIIVIGGLKVSLTEVEMVMKQHPKVKEALVFFHNNEIEAYIGTDSDITQPQLLQWSTQHLAAYKIPKAIYIGRELPKTSTGKLIRIRDAVRGHILCQAEVASQNKN